MVSQHFVYLEDQTNEPDEHHYHELFSDILYLEFQINENKKKPGDDTKKGEKYYQLIDDIVLNAIAKGQKKEDESQ